MPEVIIKYENPETLKVLEALAEPLAFEINSSSDEKLLEEILVSSDQESRKEYFINGVKMIPGDPNADITELRKVFSGKNIDAKKLREEAWRLPK